MTPRFPSVSWVIGVLVFLVVAVALEMRTARDFSVSSVLGLLLVLLVLNAVFFTLYFLLSLPFRRAERARMFLELLEEGARAGNVERFLERVAEARESSLGTRFHLLAAWLAKGVPLDEALAKVPRLLPPDAVVGRETGQFAAVLPLCRDRLRDPGGAVRVAQGRMLMLLCGVLPLQLLVFTMMRVVVWPKFREIGLDMGADLTVLELAMEHFTWLWPLVFAVFGGPVLLGLFGHVTGPRAWTWAPVVFPALGSWLVTRCAWLPRLPDALALRLPWNRRRLERDFARVLAQLLDLRLPEERAVRLAAESTANSAFIARAARAADALARGTKLPDALALLDESRELRWRLDTAAQSVRSSGSPAEPRSDFQTALAGWIAALDAKAFQAEQTAAHVMSAAFVIANGALVALVCAGTMQMLISLIGVAGEW
jgi:hypothetical protein